MTGKPLPNFRQLVVDVANTDRDHAKSVMFMELYRCDCSAQQPDISDVVYFWSCLKIQIAPMLQRLTGDNAGVPARSNGNNKHMLICTLNHSGMDALNSFQIYKEFSTALGLLSAGILLPCVPTPSRAAMQPSV